MTVPTICFGGLRHLFSLLTFLQKTQSCLMTYLYFQGNVLCKSFCRQLTELTQTRHQCSLFLFNVLAKALFAIICMDCCHLSVVISQLGHCLLILFPSCKKLCGKGVKQGEAEGFDLQARDCV